MPIIYKKYGHTAEITEIEKEPSKVRVYTPRKRRTVYGPRRPDNVRRTKQTCVRRVLTALAEFGCPLFLTLTFAGDASDAAYANDALRRFQVRLRNKYPAAQSIFGVDLSPRGRIHFHGLLFNVPLSLGDKSQGRRIVAYGEEREKRTLAKLWGEGNLDARQTDGSERLAYYVSKYITKTASQPLFNAMRPFRISQGFPKEVVLHGEVAEYVASHYAKRKPDREWIGERDYVGIIIKKIYYQKET